MIRIETERLILRAPEQKDAAAVEAFYQTDRARFVGGSADASLRQAWLMTAAYLGHWTYRGYGLFAVTEKGNDDIIGMIGPWYPAMWPETELGWVLFEGHEGLGLAFEAALAARQYCQDTLGWTEIVSYISPGNLRSVHLAERMGAVFDPYAKQPNDAKPVLIYRHPKPEVLS